MASSSLLYTVNGDSSKQKKVVYPAIRLDKSWMSRTQVCVDSCFGAHYNLRTSPLAIYAFAYLPSQLFDSTIKELGELTNA